MKYVFATLALVVSSAGAAAQDAPAQESHATVRQACKQDLQQFCNGVQPGGGRVAQCLKAHADQLSDGCKAAVQTKRSQTQSQTPSK